MIDRTWRPVQGDVNKLVLLVQSLNATGFNKMLYDRADQRGLKCTGASYSLTTDR